VGLLTDNPSAKLPILNNSNFDFRADQYMSRVKSRPPAEFCSFRRKKAKEEFMRLRRNQFCPIHRSVYCCGREQNRKPRVIRLGVQRVDDPHHPRGYRELRSPTEMRKLLDRKIVEQNGICPLCEKEFTNYGDVAPDHKRCKGMGGAWRDDHPDNIQAVHWWCNDEKGSTRME
jgi:hypothetical protein